MWEQYLSEIEALYITHYDKLFMYAVRILKDETLAEEAVQETFRIACQKANVFFEHRNKEGWLVNTLKYVISNIEKMQFRANRSMIEYTASIPSKFFPEIGTPITGTVVIPATTPAT